MKKLLFFSLSLSFCLTFAQNTNENISLIFDQLTKKDVIKLVEEKTNYRFYYIEDWLDDSLLSRTYKDSSINEILTDIFENTSINYYFTEDNKIILTENNIIHNYLPDNFFNDVKKDTPLKNRVTPVFYQKQWKNPIAKIKTIKIGKEEVNKTKAFYTLSGNIKNKNTNLPVDNLIILVKNKNINTVTDQNGHYTLKLPSGENIIEVRKLGLESLIQKLIIYNDGVLNFDMNENEELLNEIVLNTTIQKNIEDVTTSVVKIDVEKSKTIPLVLGERDILKVATTLPGITTAGEGAAGYNVRGGKTDQNLILLDDATIYNPSHFFGIFSALNPYTTGTAEIYKGHIPAEFGGRLSSVFDIKTKDANVNKFSGEGAIGPVTSNLTLETPIIKNKAALIIGGRATYSDWVLKSLDEESLKNSKASFYDIIMKYNHKINDKNTLKTTAYFSKDKFKITSDSLFSYRNRLFSMKWSHKFNDKNNGSLIIANSEYKFNIKYDSQNYDNFNSSYDINETELKLKMKYSHNKNQKINYGLSSKLYNINPGEKAGINTSSTVTSIRIPKEKALESALFISDELKISKKLQVNAGIRYSLYVALGKGSQRRYEANKPKDESTVIDTLNFSQNEVIKKYSGPEIRIGARYLITPSFSTKISFNSTYQYSHTLSNNTTSSPTDTWRLSNLNIKPQQASQLTLGFYKNIDDNTYQLSIEGYYKKLKNVLDYKIGGDLYLNKNIETEVIQGDGKAYGIEFLAKKLNGKLNGWISYTYSRSLTRLNGKTLEERVNNGNYYPSNFDKPHDFSLVSNYKLTKRYSLSANFSYQTGRPITYPVGEYVYNGTEYALYSNRNEFRIPDYYRLDIGINIEGNHKIKKLAHSFWNISIYNVLGRKNPYSIYFVSKNGQTKAYQSSIFSMPIPTITYNFKF